MPRFAPNQIRHAIATLIRSSHGLEATRTVLGHSTSATTEIYAELDQERARTIMEEIG